MKSKHLFLTLIICLFTTATFSQFNLEWTNNYQGIGLQFQLSCMDVDSYGNTYIVGNDSFSVGKLIKVDSTGSLAWVFIDSINHPKFFVAIDHQQNCITVDSRSSNGYFYVKVQKFSPGGTLLWSYIYPHIGQDVVSGLKIDDHNNIYVSYFKAETNQVSIGAGLLKLDSDRNLLWENLNPHDKLWWNRNFEILPDHSIINQYYSWRDTTGGLVPDSHLYKVNSSGQTEWQVDSLWQATSDVLVDQFQNSYESAYNDSEFYLLKYDLAGHQLWKKVLFDDVYFYHDYYGINKEYSYYTAGKLVTKSALYLVVDQYRFNSGNSEFIKIHLFKIGFNGNILWQYDYENPAIEVSFGRNLFQTCNSNLILEGYEYPDTFGLMFLKFFCLLLTHWEMNCIKAQ
ncbi:MAG TPA: hypothetical protein VE978_24365 [Chitinophagales bacterium]|nr:hypothetical protein [Chitinophagales bacterium]